MPDDVRTEHPDLDPYPNYKWLREHTPVCSLVGQDGAPVHFVTSDELVRASLTDQRLSADGLGPDNALIGADPGDHERLRRLMSAMLPNGLVDAARPGIERLCHAAIDRFAGRGQADLMTEYALEIPVAVMHDLVGLPPAERESAQVCMDHFWRASFSRQRDPDALAFIDNYLRRIVAHKRTSPGPDITTALLQLLADGELRDEREVRTILYSLLGGGHVSTGPFIASAIVRLLQHPDQLALVMADPDRWPAVVEEVLRYDSAVQSARDRYALEPMEIGGVRVNKDEVVLLSLGAANRDPARFERPEEFDTSRTPSSHLAFSHGKHFCPGSRLARAEGVIALSILFDRIPDLRLTRPDEEIEWSFGPALRGPAHVPVCFSPHRPGDGTTEHPR